MMNSFRSKNGQKLFRNQSKSIKFATSCDGNVDGMKKWIGNNFLNHSLPKLFRQKVRGLVQLLMQNILVVKVTHSVHGPFK